LSKDDEKNNKELAYHCRKKMVVPRAAGKRAAAAQSFSGHLQLPRVAGKRAAAAQSFSGRLQLPSCWPLTPGTAKAAKQCAEPTPAYVVLAREYILENIVVLSFYHFSGKLLWQFFKIKS
jgi:hypothetical protein